jgi:hypothetical protein
MGEENWFMIHGEGARMQNRWWYKNLSMLYSIWLKGRAGYFYDGAIRGDLLLEQLRDLTLRIYWRWWKYERLELLSCTL